MFGQMGTGTLDERIHELVETQVAGHEKYYLGKVFEGAILERIRRLRQRLVKRLAETAANPAELARTRQTLDLLLFLENLNAHSMQYLYERPSWERLVETVQRIEETVSDAVETSVGRMGATVVIGPSLDTRVVAGADLMSQMASGIQGLLDRLVSQGPPLEWNCPPPLANRA